MDGGLFARQELGSRKASNYGGPIMKLLQIGDNGGLCLFFWQEFRVFEGCAVAVSCLRAIGPLFWDFGEAVTEGVDDQFQSV